MLKFILAPFFYLYQFQFKFSLIVHYHIYMVIKLQEQEKSNIQIFGIYKISLNFSLSQFSHHKIQQIHWIYILYNIVLFHIMKDKMKSYFGENITESSSNINLDFSLTFKKQHRKTLGEEEEHEDRSMQNMSRTRLPHYYSPPKNKHDYVDYKKVIQENQRLREQVKSLKQLLVNSNAISKNYQKIDGSLRLKKDQKVEQISKLKKIIQKSYYSIKQMQDQISKLNQELSMSNKNLVALEKKYKILEFQKEELQNKNNNINLVHKHQIELCSDRIWRLEMKIKDLIELIEQDQINWSLHTQELGNLKKFYYKGTSK